MNGLFYVTGISSRVGLSFQSLDVSHTLLGPAVVKALIARSKDALVDLGIVGLYCETRQTGEPIAPSPLVEAGIVFPKLRSIRAQHIQIDTSKLVDLTRACPTLERFSCNFVPLDVPTLRYAVPSCRTSLYIPPGT